VLLFYHSQSFDLFVAIWWVSVWSKEEVERCKQKDLLEEMLREMTGEFPALSRVFVAERDIYLANSLHLAAQPIPDPRSNTGCWLFGVFLALLSVVAPVVENQNL
jgi:hypothetical protein